MLRRSSSSSHPQDLSAKTAAQAVGQVSNGIPEGLHHPIARSAGAALGHDTCALGSSRRKQHKLRFAWGATDLLWALELPNSKNSS
jgi:hypothetical protein